MGIADVGMWTPVCYQRDRQVIESFPGNIGEPRKVDVVNTIEWTSRRHIFGYSTHPYNNTYLLSVPFTI